MLDRHRSWSRWRALTTAGTLLALSLTAACTNAPSVLDDDPGPSAAGSRRQGSDPVTTKQEIAAIGWAFHERLAPVVARGDAGFSQPQLDTALVDLETCLLDNRDSLGASTRLDPDEERRPGDLLARLLRGRDEVVQTCITYRLVPHRVGIDRAPPLVAAFRAERVAALTAAEWSLADPADLGPLAITVSSSAGEHLSGGRIRYCLTLPQPGAMLVTWRRPDGATTRERAAYYRADADPYQGRAGCVSTVLPSSATLDVPGQTCLRVAFAGRNGLRAIAEICFAVTGFQPPVPALAPSTPPLPPPPAPATAP